VIGHLLVTRHVGKSEINKIAGLTILFTVRVIYSLKTLAFYAVTPCNLVYFSGQFTILMTSEPYRNERSIRFL
jgi:hypothetical protein